MILEAQASGLPVVAVAEGGPTELIADGRSGAAVPAATPSALADAVCGLAGSRAARERLARGGLAAVARAHLGRGSLARLAAGWRRGAGAGRGGRDYRRTRHARRECRRVPTRARRPSRRRSPTPRGPRCGSSRPLRVVDVALFYGERSGGIRTYLDAKAARARRAAASSTTSSCRGAASATPSTAAPGATSCRRCASRRPTATAGRSASAR